MTSTGQVLPVRAVVLVGLSFVLAASRLVGQPADTAAPGLFGWSGKLRVHFLPAPSAAPVEDSVLLAAAPAPDSSTAGTVASPQMAFITLLPFSLKAHGRVGDYHVGYWPAERRKARSEMYENPDGFIEVTPENQDTPVSEHFQLRDFLTHDQEGVWPKYLVLRETIVDKLELIIDDLKAHGYRVDKMVVMSGFRTPEYNIQGVGRRGGRALDSRHQFGDAADIYVDNGTGEMADLNGDGRVDSRDARVLLDAVDRVEAAHPELVGGAGVYRGTRLHGPFLHVDCRGTPARWTVTRGEHLRAPVKKKKVAAP